MKFSNKQGLWDRDKEGFYHCCNCNQALMIGGTFKNVHDTSMFCGQCMVKEKNQARNEALEEAIETANLILLNRVYREPTNSYYRNGIGRGFKDTGENKRKRLLIEKLESLKKEAEKK